MAEPENSAGSGLWRQLGAWAGRRSNRGAQQSTAADRPQLADRGAELPHGPASSSAEIEGGPSSGDLLEPQTSATGNSSSRPSRRNPRLSGSPPVREQGQTNPGLLDQLQQARKLAEQWRQGGTAPPSLGNDPSMRSPLGDPSVDFSNRVEMKELIDQLNQVAKSLPPDFNLNGLTMPSDGSFLPERLQDWASNAGRDRSSGGERRSPGPRRGGSDPADGDPDAIDDSQSENSSSWISRQGLERIVREQMERSRAGNSGGTLDANGDWTKRVFESVFKAATAHSDEILQDLQRPENQAKFGKWIQRGREINDWLVRQKRSVRQGMASHTPDVTLPRRPNWGGGWGGRSVPDMSWDLTGVWTLAILVAIGGMLAAAVVWGRQQIASGRGFLPAWISIPSVEDRQTLIAAVHGTARRQYGPSAEYWTIQRLTAAAERGHPAAAGPGSTGRPDGDEVRADRNSTTLTQRLLELYNFSRYARPELTLSEAQVAEARSALDHLQHQAREQVDTAGGGWWRRRDEGSADG